jgi:hypothetical protein
MRWSQASAVAELGIRVALKAPFIGAMFGDEHGRYPDFSQSAFSGADPNHFTQLCPYLRRKNPARDSFRGTLPRVRFPASRRKTCSAKLLGEPIFNAVDGVREHIV